MVWPGITGWTAGSGSGSAVSGEWDEGTAQRWAPSKAAKRTGTSLTVSVMSGIARSVAATRAERGSILQLLHLHVHTKGNETFYPASMHVQLQN